MVMSIEKRKKNNLISISTTFGASFKSMKLAIPKGVKIHYIGLIDFSLNAFKSRRERI